MPKPGSRRYGTRHRMCIPIAFNNFTESAPTGVMVAIKQTIQMLPINIILVYFVFFTRVFSLMVLQTSLERT
jgi:hypothetical protein